MTENLLLAEALPITSCFGTLLILLITAAAMNTTRMRFKGFGKMSDPKVVDAIRAASRAHGNTFEHSLPVILLMMFYELQGGSTTVLCILGSVFLAARLLYVAGMLTKPGGKPMQLAAGVTYLTELVAIALVLGKLL